MNSYKVLKFDDHFVYLTQDGKIKKLARDLFDFDIALGIELIISKMVILS